MLYGVCGAGWEDLTAGVASQLKESLSGSMCMSAVGAEYRLGLHSRLAARIPSGDFSVGPGSRLQGL